MDQDAFCAVVCFAAECGVLFCAVAEVIVVAFVFGLGACDEVFYVGFEVFKAAFVDFEIRVDADCL